MAKQQGRRFSKFADWLFADPSASTNQSREDYFTRVNLVQAAETAKNHWLAAKSYFDNISEPDLVDHAIYSLEAAERKYMFILKKLKESEPDK